MDAQVVSFLGTALSALIAALSYRGKVRHERQRSTRTVLYYLLEIHHFLSRSVLGVSEFPKEYISKITDQLKARGVVLSGADAAALPLQIELAMRGLLHAELTKLRAAIAVPFESALRELARDDPVLAFDLRGKDSIASISELLKSLDPRSDAQSLQSMDTAQVNTLLNLLDDRMRIFLVDEIVRSIYFTAWRCDLLTNYRVRRHVRKAAEIRSLEDISPEISDFIVAMADQMAEQASSNQ